MELITTIFSQINDLGATITMPIIFTIIGLLIGMKFGQALKSGLMYGIGFAGLWLVLDYFMAALSEAANGISANLGLNLTVVDAGWMLGSTMAFSSSLLPVGLIACIGLNILLILVGFLKTLDIDIWNYWMVIS